MYSEYYTRKCIHTRSLAYQEHVGQVDLDGKGDSLLDVRRERHVKVLRHSVASEPEEGNRNRNHRAAGGASSEQRPKHKRSEKQRDSGGGDPC